MHVCFVLRGYPTKRDPYQTFSRELIAQIAKNGVKCSVVAPQSITRAIKHKVPIRPKFWQDRIDDNIVIDIYQPYFVSLSTYAESVLKNLRLFAAKKVMKQIKDKVDIVYGHFWDMGVLAAKITDNVPVFVGCGEAYIQNILNRISAEELEVLQKKLTGVIYVSTSAYNDACRYGLQKNTKYLIAPNGFNPQEFFEEEKDKCRRKLGWSLDDFIVSFVGSFDDRKGVFRLIEAVKNEKDVKLALIGKGTEISPNNQIIFAGGLPHADINMYLNASDVFVLPTQAEGCCNAIVEAIACGLPIISSTGEFNDDILNVNNSIRIDPNSVNEIHDAIIQLKNNHAKRITLQKGSSDKAKELSIEARAKKILDFMTDC